MCIKDRQIALLGCSGVGKSTISLQFCANTYDEHHVPTVEDRFVKLFTIEKQEYRVRILDTMGQNKWSYIPLEYAMEVNGYCLVYSIDNRNSFEMVEVLHDKLLNMTGNIELPVTLVGNKCDLSLLRSVSTEEGEQLAKNMGAVFHEISAMKYEDVIELIKNILLYIDNISLYERQVSRGQSVVSVDSGPSQETQSTEEQGLKNEMYELEPISAVSLSMESSTQTSIVRSIRNVERKRWGCHCILCNCM